MDENLKPLNEVVWEEIFEGWARREEKQRDWQKVAQDKGWSNWREWRNFMADQFGAADRRWEIFRMLQPGIIIPQMLVGPFQGWHKFAYFKDSDLPMNQRTFSKLAELKAEELRANSKITGMMQNYPRETQMIGIRLVNDQIVCMEGTHGSLAATLAEGDQPIDFSQRDVTIALTDFKEGEEIILDAMLERGSDKVKK